MIQSRMMLMSAVQVGHHIVKYMTTPLVVGDESTVESMTELPRESVNVKFGAS